MSVTDRQLIQSARAGDMAAFEQIVIQNERTVLRVAQRLLLNEDEAKDAAQEVFLRFHQTIRKFDDVRELGPWLYRMTVNICRDMQRKSRPNLSIESAHEVSAFEPDPEQAAVSGQQHEMILSALRRLSPHEREAIVLRDLEDCSTSEVARILGSSEATVRSQLSTGRLKLRNFLSARIARFT